MSISAAHPQVNQVPIPKNLEGTLKKVDIVSKSTFSVKKVIQSKKFKSILIAGVGVGILFAIASNPAGWVIGAVAGGSFLVSYLAQKAFEPGSTTYLFESSHSRGVEREVVYYQIDISKMNHMSIAQMQPVNRLIQQHHDIGQDVEIQLVGRSKNERACNGCFNYLSTQLD